MLLAANVKKVPQSQQYDYKFSHLHYNLEER